MEEKTFKNGLFTISRAFVAVSAGIMIAAEPFAHAYQRSQGIRPNQKCEDQLPAIFEKTDLFRNGESHYNPWLRQCSYTYYDYKLQNVEMDEDKKYKTYQWSLLFN